RCEAITAAIGIHDRSGQRSGSEGAPGLQPAAEAPGRRHDRPRRRVKVPRVVKLAFVLPAPHEDVELHARFPQRRELARRGHEDVSRTHDPARRASCTAATAPPPAGSSQVSNAWAISPGFGTASTLANSTHST